ncbi:M56 family metallopeptidase [Fimbriiglobus ruber]|uniref:High-affnity carbon uptake protein Hat/HatR n=1 Tax=Fimbriiglobus ruber TaxID=1908690 RepID=A0A225DC57_9BACT|nr:M56 family metallopeptidase [Fimbriiglobus ruber]OWK36118.1 High-affnity carbon uptake protein Hat/HatR [Fimbriiglobus ruber]
MAPLAAPLEAVLGNVVAATALAGVAYAVGRWAGRPALTHTLWLLVLVKLVTPALITVPVRCLPAEPASALVGPPTPAPTPAGPFAAAGTVGGADPVAMAAPPDAPFASIETVTTAPASPGGAIAPPELPSTSATSHAEWLLCGAWLAGCLVCLALATERVRRFSRLLQLSTAPPAELAADVATVAGRMRLRRVPIARLVAGGIAPLVWALGRPTVYFPAGLLARLSPDQRLTVVAHELAHVRRWDHLVRWVEFAIVSVYWWCPLAWIARRELRRREEEACDAEVTAAFPGSGYAYASAVLETIDYLAGAPPRFRAAHGMASGIGEAESLRQRLVLILGSRRASRGSAIPRAVVLIAAALFLAFGPRLARSTADASEPPIVETAATTPVRPVVADGPIEPAEEAVQFAANPTRLLDPAADGRGGWVAATLSQDGRRLILAAGPTVTVWDRTTKREVVILDGHTDMVTAVAVSPDGRTIATAGNDGVAKLWGANGRFLHTLTGGSRWVTAVAFSPDGKTIATTGYDRIVRLWNVATGEPLAALSGHTAAVRAVAFSPDGKTLATGGADHLVRLWDLVRGETVRVFAKHSATVRAVAFSPDGSRLATGSEDRTVRVWNPADGREVGPPIAVPDFVTALGFSVHGGVLLVGTSGGHLLNIDPATALARGYLGVAPGSPDLLPAHATTVTAVLSDPVGGMMLTVSRDGTVLAWPAARAVEPTRIFRTGSHLVSVVALSPDGRTLATAGPNGVIRLWDATTARELGSLPGHPGGVTALVFAPGGRLVSTGADERVRVWDTATGLVLYTVTHQTADLHVALSPDGRTLAVGGRTLPGVALWDLTTGTLVRRVGMGEGEVTTVAFTPTGDRIATGYADGTLRFWSAADGDEVQHGTVGGRVDGISFSADGSTAAVVINSDGSADDDDPGAGPVHAVVFWDVRDATPRDRSRPLTHPGPVTAAAFTADGQRVLTAARDGNLYLWDAETGRLTRTVRAHRDAVRGVAMRPDGTAVYSAGDRAAKWWPMPPTGKPDPKTSTPAP